MTQTPALLSAQKADGGVPGTITFQGRGDSRAAVCYPTSRNFLKPPRAHSTLADPQKGSWREELRCSTLLLPHSSRTIAFFFVVGLCAPNHASPMGMCITFKFHPGTAQTGVASHFIPVSVAQENHLPTGRTKIFESRLFTH